MITSSDATEEAKTIVSEIINSMQLTVVLIFFFFLINNLNSYFFFFFDLNRYKKWTSDSDNSCSSAR
jgi:hypothetical protein